MKTGFALAVLLTALLASVPAHAAGQRADVFWARTSPGPITLDGKLNEGAWAQAESVVIRYGQSAGIPGSGWKNEGGLAFTDPTYAVLKFLVVGNQLYMGATVKDTSVGGSDQFNHFDGFLIGIHDHSTGTYPAPVSEYTYTWWWPGFDPNPTAPGKLPSFIGRYGVYPPGSVARDSTQVANWDAVTVVHGLSNSDAGPDTGYTVEMRFNLTPLGYHVDSGSGDIVEFNISIYDCDYFWPFLASKFAANRVWWQGPWANTSNYDEVHMYARPSVTTSSGPVPIVPAELTIPNAATFASPVIDGKLNEAVWQSAPRFDIRYGDDVLRATYPGVGLYRAGQYQPTVNARQSAVTDPGDATVKYFFKGDSLFLGFDVRDQAVQYIANNFDRYDGFLVSINARDTLSVDNNLQGRRLEFQVGPTGNLIPLEYLPTMMSAGGTQAALSLRGGTTVDTFGTNADSGYTAEMKIDLTKLGYPHGLGDGVVFLGINLLDGDSYTPFTDSYSDRTWWFREYDNTCCPVWAVMDPATQIVGVGDPGSQAPMRFAALGNYPNPAIRSTNLRYSMAEPGNVKVEVYDPEGRRVASHALGYQVAGTQQVQVTRPVGRGGLYFYRLVVTDRANGSVKSMMTGKMVFLK